MVLSFGNLKRSLAFIVVLSTVPTAFAGLIFDNAVVVSGVGFGNIPRDLTVQATGRDNTQSGCIGLTGSGALTFGSCISDAGVFMGNGVTNVGGQEPNPQTDDNKYGAPTLASLGITNANEIQIIFDATEPSGDGITITDLTLKLYDANNQFVGAIDGSHTFASTIPGNGGAGFAFVIDAVQQGQVNTWIQNGAARMTLEASFADYAGGPESFFIRNGGAAIPEPSTYVLISTALVSIGLIRLRRC